MKRFLYPQGSMRDHLTMVAIALGGALVAGIYGCLHDQITYSISPEYFTRMKFEQFRQADFGLPVRIFVAEIGFLATWWVGLIGMWFLARLAFRNDSLPQGVPACGRGCLLMFGVAVLGGVMGWWMGPLIYHGREWNVYLSSLRIRDGGAFTRVAGIHLGSYVGALLGWIVAVVSIWMKNPGKKDASLFPGGLSSSHDD